MNTLVTIKHILLMQAISHWCCPLPPCRFRMSVYKLPN